MDHESASRTLALVLVEMRDRAGASGAAVVHALNQRYPSLPVIGCCQSLDPRTAGDISAAAKLGMSRVVVCEYDDVRREIRSVLGSRD